MFKFNVHYICAKLIPTYVQHFAAHCASHVLIKRLYIKSGMQEVFIEYYDCNNFRGCLALFEGIQNELPNGI